MVQVSFLAFVGVHDFQAKSNETKPRKKTSNKEKTVGKTSVKNEKAAKTLASKSASSFGTAKINQLFAKKVRGRGVEGLASLCSLSFFSFFKKKKTSSENPMYCNLGKQEAVAADPAPKSLMERLAERKKIVQPRPSSSASEQVTDNNLDVRKAVGKTTSAQGRSASLGPAASRGTRNSPIYSFL